MRDINASLRLGVRRSANPEQQSGYRHAQQLIVHHFHSC
jgi:hypothetical protein